MTAGRRVGGGDFLGQTFTGRSLHVILFQYTKKTRFPARLGHLSDSVGLKIEVRIEVAESATGPFWTVVQTELRLRETWSPIWGRRTVHGMFQVPWPICLGVQAGFEWLNFDGSTVGAM